MDKLEELILERDNDGKPEREIHEEEQKKIDEWGNEIKDQVNL